MLPKRSSTGVSIAGCTGKGSVHGAWRTVHGKRRNPDHRQERRDRSAALPQPNPWPRPGKQEGPNDVEIQHSQKLSSITNMSRQGRPKHEIRSTKQIRSSKIDGFVRSRHPGSRLLPGQGHRDSDILQMLEEHRFRPVQQALRDPQGPEPVEGLSPE
jgi:hypothetical protein